ncbi:MAG: hypothetical protein IH945_02180 [Armatimonadetes bacterium]|nr:hypothetical protein [Armatimonadota bacterium]
MTGTDKLLMQDRTDLIATVALKVVLAVPMAPFWIVAWAMTVLGDVGNLLTLPCWWYVKTVLAPIDAKRLDRLRARAEQYKRLEEARRKSS